jgi:chromosome segregation ATPase
MIANISPASSHFDETMNTLKYASRAISIKAQVTQQAMLRGEDYDLALQQFQQEAEINTAQKLQKQETEMNAYKLQKQESMVQSRVKQPSNLPVSDTQVNALKKSLQDLFSQQLEVKMQIMDCQDTEAETTRSMSYKKLVIDQLEAQLKLSTDSAGQNSIKSKIQTEKAHIKNLGRNQNHASNTKKGLEKQMKEYDDRISNFTNVRILTRLFLKTQTQVFLSNSRCSSRCISWRWRVDLLTRFRTGSKFHDKESPAAAC